MCVLNFEFSSMHDKKIFVWLFFFPTVASIPNVVAEASPFLCLICSRDPL